MSIRRPTIALMLLALVAAILPVSAALRAAPAGATPSEDGGCPTGTFPVFLATGYLGGKVYASSPWEGLVDATVGTNPLGIAVRANRYAYIANNGSDDVSVVDLYDGTVTGPIAVGDGPVGIAVTPVGDKVYVANKNAGTVSVISTVDNSVTTPITGLSAPQDVAVAPDGVYAWVTDNTADEVVQIRTSDNSVVDHVSVGDGPRGVVVSPNSAKVYVAGAGDGTVRVVDVTNVNAVTTLVTLTAGLAEFALTSDGATLFVSNEPQSTVDKIKTSDGTVLGTIPAGPFQLGPYGLALTPDDSILFVVNEAGAIVVWDPSDLSLLGPGIIPGEQPLYGAVACVPPPASPAPTDVTAALVTPSGNALSVDATPPASGDDPTGYQVRCMPASYPWNSGDGGPVVYKGTETLPVTVGGLTRGLDYKCYVRARYGSELFSWLGDDNEGPLSVASNVVRIAAVAPPVPTGVVASVPSAPDPRATAVSFSLPANPSGAPVTANTARCTSSTGGTTRTATGSATGPVTVAGLTPGARYTCQVASTNSAGTSSFSTASAAIDVPAAPVTGVVASVANAKTRTISVRFTPPVGGSVAPVRYDARCSTVQGAPLTVTGKAGSSPVSVYGATGGRFYRCTVRAVYPAGNSGGDSAPSNTVRVG